MMPFPQLGNEDQPMAVSPSAPRGASARSLTAVPLSRREAGRVLAIATGIGLMAALALDLLTGRWVASPWLHIVLAVLFVGAWLPIGRRYKYIQYGPLYVLGLFVYTVLRSFADKTGVPHQADYVIRLEERLFFGHVPTMWLQEHFFSPASLGPLDWLTVQVHWSYFFVPHLALLLVWLFRRELLPRYIFLVLGTFYAGLVLYFLVPTVPPWLAADYGSLYGVERVMDYVGHRLEPGTYQKMYDSLGVPNPVAAMPSLHMGVTFAVYLFARQVANRWLSRALLLYVVAMGFSLVYMGEHYTIDLLVGIGCASFVYAMLRLWQRRAEAAPTPSEQ
jgi:membrane-associated phospholipid phosphatase